MCDYERIADNLAPNTLFHLTQDQESLVSIIKDGFRPSFALEAGIIDKEQYYTLSICFSDLRIRELREKQLESYGSYGIGMSKQWGIDNNLNPVFYINSSGHIPRDFRSLYEILSEINLLEGQKEWEGYTMSGESGITDFLCFVKNYKGVLERKGKPKVEDFYFVDEREWRYVPNNSQVSFALDLSITNRNKYTGDEGMKSELNNSIKEIPRLPVHINDLKYLIFPNEEEACATLDKIENDRILTPKEVNQMRLRVITKESIYKDF